MLGGCAEWSDCLEPTLEASFRTSNILARRPAVAMVAAVAEVALWRRCGGSKGGGGGGAGGDGSGDGSDEGVG